jgi:hypothetical protein
VTIALDVGGDGNGCAEFSASVSAVQEMVRGIQANILVWEGTKHTHQTAAPKHSSPAGGTDYQLVPSITIELTQGHCSAGS